MGWLFWNLEANSRGLGGQSGGLFSPLDQRRWAERDSSGSDVWLEMVGHHTHD